MSASLHFVARGDGIPVLAVHGWSPDHRLMTGCLEPVFERRTGFRRLYPDLPGMGRSPAGDAASSDDLLAAIDGFIEERIGTEPFLLLGQSYGGYLARAVACARAEQVLGLALICPLAEPVPHKDRELPPRTVIRTDPGVTDGLSGVDAGFADIAVVRSAETLRRFRADVAPGLALADGEAMARIHRRWALSAPPEAAGGFERPTVIVTGRQDSSTGYADVYRLLDHYPRATFAILDSAGHNLQFEQPELLTSLLGEWLDRVAE